MRLISDSVSFLQKKGDRSLGVGHCPEIVSRQMSLPWAQIFLQTFDVTQMRPLQSSLNVCLNLRKNEIMLHPADWKSLQPRMLEDRV